MLANEKVVDDSHREDRIGIDGRLGNRVEECRPGFRFVVSHLQVERRAPGSFVRSLGIADETSVAISMEARTVCDATRAEQCRVRRGIAQS